MLSLHGAFTHDFAFIWALVSIYTWLYLFFIILTQRLSLIFIFLLAERLESTLRSLLNIQQILLAYFHRRVILIFVH